MSLFRKKKTPSNESPKSPKLESAPKNNPKTDETEHAQKQLNGTIKQPSESANLDNNYNTVKEGYKNDYEISQKTVSDEKKEEVKKITNERR